jgi:hypothetical protein
MLQTLIDDYKTLVRQSKQQTAILREIKNRQDRDDWWKQ